jgi:AcrR family transcriptional regulator
MKSRKNAISELEKLQRFQHIVDTTERLFEDSNFHEITMAKIAEKAGLAKGTLFIYFQTKEDVFLSLAEQKIKQWSGLVANLLEDTRAKKDIQVDEFIDILITSLDNKVLVKLLAIMDDTLEQNIDFIRAVQFKTFLRGIMIDLGKSIEAIFPKLRQGDGMILLNQFFICFIGAYKVSTPSAVVRQVVKQPGLEIFDKDFFATFRDMAVYHMIGYLIINQKQ